MISCKIVMIAATLCVTGSAAVHSGKASAEWLAASATYQAGKPVQTAVRIVVDEGWHTYWENPGEGGMKISVKWELPAGWTAGEFEQPVPKRFKTGDLPGFGYEGTVIFPVVVTPPADFKGEAVLKGKVSWLTCNEEKCVPGDAALELKVTAGAPVATPDSELVAKALLKIPVPANDGRTLEVAKNGESFALTLKGKELKADDYEVFPATPQVVDAAAPIVFKKDGANWSAVVPKSEYAAEAIPELTLVFAGKSGQPPFSVTWKAP